MDSTESRDLLERSARWVDQLTKSFPDRDFKVTASDTTGRPIFIPRFLRPLPLPPLDGINDGLSVADSSGGAGNLEVSTISLFLFFFVNQAEHFSEHFSNVWLASYH